MSIIQRRADSGARSGKYVAVVYMSKQFFSTDYGLSFTEKKYNFTYLPVAVAISEDMGDVFVLTHGMTNNIYVSRDSFDTTNIIKPNTLFDNVLGMDITKNGEMMCVLGDTYERTIDIPNGTLLQNILNESFKARKIAVSANGKLKVVAGEYSILGSNDNPKVWNISIPIDSPSTKNQFYDMVMSGDGRCIFYSYVSGSEDYNGLFRLHSSDGFTTRERISVAGINNYYVPIQICVSYTGKHILLKYSSQGTYISHDFGRSFTKLVDLSDASQFAMSSNGKYIYCINGAALYRSADYGNTFSLALSGVHSAYKLAISK